MTSYLLIFVVAVASLHLADSTKCYTCTSATDTKCGDPRSLEESKAVECTSDALKQVAEFYNTAGKKLADWGSSLGLNIQAKAVDANLVCSKIDITEGDKTVVIRGCSVPPTDTFDPCKTIKEKYTSDVAKLSFCGVCSSDYCNSAPTLKVWASFLVPLVALVLSNRY